MGDASVGLGSARFARICLIGCILPEESSAMPLLVMMAGKYFCNNKISIDCGLCGGKNEKNSYDKPSPNVYQA
jgi:hypothetical protein